MGRRRLRGLAPALALSSLCLAAAPAARAQLSLSASAETEYRFRGLPVTDGRADVRLGLAYDHPSGAYAGASITMGGGSRGGVQAVGYSGYLGYARRTTGGTTLDVGAAATRILDNYGFALTGYPRRPDGYPTTVPVHYRASYAEVYAGLARGPVSARLYLSPSYLGLDAKTAYLDLAAATRPVGGLRLFAHLGVLQALEGRLTRDGGATRYDARAGAAWQLGRAELQLAWVGSWPDADYPLGRRHSRDAVIASASAFF